MTDQRDIDLNEVLELQHKWAGAILGISQAYLEITATTSARAS